MKEADTKTGQKKKTVVTAISVLLILWFSFRTTKYFIFWQPTAIRYMWYHFYLPMLFVPMLALLNALSLGKPDGYKLPKYAVDLWCISAALLLLVLTNDLHQLVFTFPEDSAIWSDTDHGYSGGRRLLHPHRRHCVAVRHAVYYS